MMNKSYRTGPFCLRMESDEPIGDADFFPLFRTEDNPSPDLTVRVLRQPLPKPEGKLVFQSNHRSRILSGGTAYDYTNYSDAASLRHVPYACVVRRGGQATLFVDYDGPLWDTMLFDAIGLPDFFLENDAAIVHASFIGVGARGVLFAGPKRQGKSTQARLWQEYQNAEIFNGDRVAVKQTNRGFTAFSIPFCGSSQICVNACREIKAVVFPDKGDQNVVLPLSPMESFQRLLGCISYTQEDAAARDHAIMLAERIAENNRCLRLICRPDAGAVEALSKALADF